MSCLDQFRDKIKDECNKIRAASISPLVTCFTELKILIHRPFLIYFGLVSLTMLIGIF